MRTQYNDHTGREIILGDCCRIELHNGTANGYITKGRGLFWFKYIDDGDEVSLHNVAPDLEVLKTFEEAVEQGLVKAI